MTRLRAFTIIEMLVVIAIIGVLVAVLIPAIICAREAGRRLSCANNLTQIIIATQTYEFAYEVYPPGTIDKQGPIANLPRGYHHGWVTSILPYLEEQNRFARVDFSVGVYHAKNVPVRTSNLRPLICPTNPQTRGPVSMYAAVHHDSEAPIDVNNNGVFFLNSRLTYRDISDGASHTLFFGEKHIDLADLGWMSGTNATLRNTGSPFAKWNKAGGMFSRLPGLPDDFIDPESGMGMPSMPRPGVPGAIFPPASFAPTPAPPRARPLEPTEPRSEGNAEPPNSADLVVGSFASFHPGGSQFAMGDGRVRFIMDTIDRAILARLAHRCDGRMNPEVY